LFPEISFIFCSTKRLIISNLNPEISIVIPCLNEANTIGICVAKAKQALLENKVSGEVIVADNGSTDGSQKIAENAGAQVVTISQIGYGAALCGGILASSGEFIIMGDGDDSYNFLEIEPFLNEWKNGTEFVIGNRFVGGIENGAMPWLHQYLGNPVLSFIGRLFFQNGFGDFHCGMRGFTREAFEKMNPNTAGMEFASEMVVKASLLQLKSKEVPIKLYKDGRGRPPHLNTWRDGWRHLRFLLLFSPRWLFYYPGLTFVFFGMLFSTLLLKSELPFQSLRLDVHTLLYTSALVLIGFQLIAFYLLSQAFARREGLYIQTSGIDLAWFQLERGLLMALGFLILGIGFSVSALQIWEVQHFGPLNPQVVLRKVIPAVTSILLAFQVGTFSFFMSFLQIRKTG
jgi:glycosyltransferase involved in cell wall biosynthesis